MLEDVMSIEEIEKDLQLATIEDQQRILQDWFGYPVSCQNAEELKAHLAEHWSGGHFLWLLAKLASLGVDWATGIREISLENVESIPDVFADLPEIRHLELAGTFTSIPESIGCVTRLLSLKLKGNIRSLPVAMGSLQYLCKIEITTERLDYIPEAVLWLFSHPDVECRLYTSSIDDASTRKMNAVVCHDSGSVNVLRYQPVIAPSIAPDYIRVQVCGVGVNRADILQRKGFYPAPSKTRKEILGLEYSGQIIEVGSEVTRWKVGDRVMGIISGGAYAEQVVVHALEAMVVPRGMDIVEAAGIPEAFMTAYDVLFLQGKIRLGDRVLVHAIGSGVGNAALQLSKVAGATVVGTSRTQEKISRAIEEGLDEGIWVRDGKFSQRLPAPVDLILDFVGAAYWQENIRSLRRGGELILVGLLGGSKTEINLAALLQKRLQVRGTVLRSRSLEEKIQLAQQFSQQILPLFEQGRLAVNIDVIFSLEEVAKAHVFMETNRSYGKIVLRV